MAEWWVEHEYEGQIFFQSYTDLEAARERVRQLIDRDVSPHKIWTTWPSPNEEEDKHEQAN